SAGRNIYLIPYVALASARVLNTPDSRAPFFSTSHELRGGLDGKVVLRDSLTLDFTINPDFSQVESDDPQVTVNQRFEVFFPEKRPFFLENASYFITPQTLFFSRRIVDPDAGVRLTGRLGQWSIGALGAGDRGEGENLAEDNPDHNRVA